MKTTKQELIDFYDWVWNNDMINTPLETEEIVEKYLESINSASNESLSVTENEAKKEFTQRLLNKMENLDPEYVSLVNNEFWNLFE